MRFLSCENCFWLHSCSKLHKVLKSCGAKVDLRAPFHLCLAPGPVPCFPFLLHGKTPEPNSLNYGPSFTCDLCDFWSTNANANACRARGLGRMELMRAKPHADCCSAVRPTWNWYLLSRHFRRSLWADFSRANKSLEPLSYFFLLSLSAAL